MIGPPEPEIKVELAVSTEVTVPLLSAAIEIDPAPFVIVIPVPPVNDANTGSAPVVPTNNCPSVGCAVAVIAPTPDPNNIPPSVNDVAPVPPLATMSVPAKVIVPEVVIGPPEVVNPVVPPETSTEVTVPLLSASIVIAPDPFVIVIPVPPVSVDFAKVFPVELPISNCPSV